MHHDQNWGSQKAQIKQKHINYTKIGEIYKMLRKQSGIDTFCGTKGNMPKRRNHLESVYENEASVHSLCIMV